VLAKHVPLLQMDLIERARVSNPVVITGDLHDSWVCDVKHDFNDPSSATIGSELIGTSISSDGDGVEINDEGAIALRENPHYASASATTGSGAARNGHPRTFLRRTAKEG
jgi:phosphodiesterase/alkaline phosphatase D-like protein